MSRVALRAASAAVRQRATGYAPRRQTNPNPTLWEHGEFVAIDGEGFSDGEAFDIRIGANRTRYTGRGHNYAYLAASDGSELYNPDGYLSLFSCLEFLCRIVETNPRAILVAFGGSYDVCHIVCRDLDRAAVAQLINSDKKGKLHVSDDDYDYLLEYRPRKCFTIQRWPLHELRWTFDRNGKRVSTPHLTVRLWDVWGFFQDSFVGVLKKWVPGDPDYDFVRRMKGDRSIFERSEIAEIKRYNAAELRLLVKVMNRVRDAINDLGLKITRWDGAGAIAAAMMTKHKVKEHKNEIPENVFHAARCAYSGGHIETCKVGYYCGPVHHYDVNSAYPDQFRNLPSLIGGKWESGNGNPPHGYTLVKLDFAFPEGLPFYPLFYRNDDGSILYPSRGSGWYWFSEYEVALRYYNSSNGKTSACHFRVAEWYHFRSDTDERPFSWVEDYYSKRQDYIRAARAGGFESGPEKIIKLGCNSLYGKTAQQVGARYDVEGNLRLPPFFQLDWAGYVTAGCRAKIMAAAIQRPSAIIGFATDGLFSTGKLDLYTPDEKELGAWEYKIHAGITTVMPGVYWLHDEDEIKHYSRGFDKKNMADPQIVHDGWKRKKTQLPISLTRLIGLGSACSSESYWQLRGCFADTKRSLRLDGKNSKRYPISLRNVKPHLGLIDTIPQSHDIADLLGFEVPPSAPFPVAWIDGVIERDLIEGEMADELEAMDAALA